MMWHRLPSSIQRPLTVKVQIIFLLFLSYAHQQGPKAAISRYMSIDYLLSTEHFNWTRNTPENCVQEKTPWDCRCFQNNFTLNDRQNVFLFGTIAEWKCPYYVLWVMTILISFSFTFPFHIKEDNACKGCLKPSLCRLIKDLLLCSAFLCLEITSPRFYMEDVNSQMSIYKHGMWNVELWSHLTFEEQQLYLMFILLVWVKMMQVPIITTKTSRNSFMYSTHYLK